MNINKCLLTMNPAKRFREYSLVEGTKKLKTNGGYAVNKPIPPQLIHIPQPIDRVRANAQTDHNWMYFYYFTG